MLVYQIAVAKTKIVVNSLTTHDGNIKFIIDAYQDGRLVKNADYYAAEGVLDIADNMLIELSEAEEVSLAPAPSSYGLSS